MIKRKTEQQNDMESSNSQTEAQLIRLMLLTSELVKLHNPHQITMKFVK